MANIHDIYFIEVVLGDTMEQCGEWADRDSLDLPGVQLQFLKELTSVSSKLVVILLSGRTVTFGLENTLLDHIGA